MEVRAYALALLAARTLEGKLRPPPDGLGDEAPGPPLRVEQAGRPPDLRREPGRRVKVPPVSGMHDPRQRRRILHALANHELQAAECFAWALLAFPEMPSSFRNGCLRILADEQRHCALYRERLEALGGHLGEEPVTNHLWAKLSTVHTPLEFVCAIGLTFENANLDFAREHAAAARAAGDVETARVLEQVHADETSHVAFAWRWFRRLKPVGQDDWSAYCAHVAPPHGPDRARGATFDAAARRAAGLDATFIRRLAATVPTRPGGAPR